MFGFSFRYQLLLILPQKYITIYQLTNFVRSFFIFSLSLLRLRFRHYYCIVVVLNFAGVPNQGYDALANRNFVGYLQRKRFCVPFQQLHGSFVRYLLAFLCQLELKYLLETNLPQNFAALVLVYLTAC